MSASITFKNHQFSDSDRLWLETAAGERPFDPRGAKAKLFGRLPSDFSPVTIDERFYRNDRLTLLGIRTFRPDDPIFESIDTLVARLRNKILDDPKLDSMSIDELASLTHKPEKLLRSAINFLNDLGPFFSGTSVGPMGELERVWLTGSRGYDAILQYDTVDALLQRWYEQMDSKLRYSALEIANLMQEGSFSEAKDSVSTTSQRKSGTAFVIMPIDPAKPELEDILVAIREACAAFSIKAYRADEIQHQDRITDVVLDEIRDCELIIADLSHERPNVYYEVGYAHALNKRPILYRRQGTQLHFDLSLHNAPEYRNATDLRDQLRKRLEAVLGRLPSAT